jgi:3-hydroxyacyl-CoA dehydrogenase
MLTISLILAIMTSYFLRNSVSFIKLSNPPVNGLSLAVRDGIMKGLDQARADKTRGVVFFGHGNNFCAGGDITEFAKHQHAASPSLNEVSGWVGVGEGVGE